MIYLIELALWVRSWWRLRRLTMHEAALLNETHRRWVIHQDVLTFKRALPEIMANYREAAQRWLNEPLLPNLSNMDDED